MEMEKIVKVLIDEVIEEHLRKYQMESAEIQDIRERMAELYDKAHVNMQILNEQRQKSLKDYAETRNAEEGLYYHYLYVAGMKDCVKLLQYFGVL